MPEVGDPIDVPCHWCKVPSGAHCRTTQGAALDRVHPSRLIWWITQLRYETEGRFRDMHQYAGTDGGPCDNCRLSEGEGNHA